MAATNIATMFLDRDLRITRYTPSTMSLFKLIPTDVGRPLDDVKHRLDYPGLDADARHVLKTLAVVEREVHKTEDGWFLARLQSYRSVDDHIAGVVLTFVNVTARKEAEAAARESEEQFRSFVEATSDAVYKMSADCSEMRHLEGKQFLADTQHPNRSWLETYIPAEDQPPVLAAIQRAIRLKRPFALEHRILRADGTLGWTSSRAIPLLNERGEITAWIGAARDVAERKQAEAALHETRSDRHTCCA